MKQLRDVALLQATCFVSNEPIHECRREAVQADCEVDEEEKYSHSVVVRLKIFNILWTFLKFLLLLVLVLSLDDDDLSDAQQWEDEVDVRSEVCHEEHTARKEHSLEHALVNFVIVLNFFAEPCDVRDVEMHLDESPGRPSYTESDQRVVMYVWPFKAKNAEYDQDCDRVS